MKLRNIRAALKMLEKIEKIERTEIPYPKEKQAFILKNRPHLDVLENYSEFEFGLLNSGQTTDQVRLESNFF